MLSTDKSFSTAAGQQPGDLGEFAKKKEMFTNSQTVKNN